MIRNDTIAIAILMLVAVLSVWLGVWGPTNTTTWKDWQPIMSAFVALGAATLAYTAAMAKVRLDERTASQTERRKLLGIFLRFDFAVDVVRYEAGNLGVLTAQPASPSENNLVVVDDLALTEVPEMKEAWSNLDYFPLVLSRLFYLVRNDLYNFEQFKKDHPGEEYPCEYGMAPAEELTDLHEIFVDLTDHCTNALEEVRAEIAVLRARMT
jgi:hypothetical protein